MSLRTSRSGNPWCGLLAVGLLPCMVWAQAPGATDASIETARIQRERQQIETRTAAEEARCYQQFSVTDCLESARARRRDALADLRRQELSLQDSQRKRQGAEQRQRIDDKADAALSAEAVQRRTDALQQQAQRQQRADEKAAERQARQAAADPARTAQDAQSRRAEKTADRASQAEASGRKQKQFDAKVQEAQERKASHLASAASQPKSTVKPLPVPP